MFQKLKRYLQEARIEIRHVNWPSRAEAIRLTGVVVGLSLGLAVFLGLFDSLFNYLLKIAVIG
jgi:preprotein translocase subunit SecE